MALSVYQLTLAGEGGDTLIHTEYSFSTDNLSNLSLYQ
jgi:hypothetical protein